MNLTVCRKILLTLILFSVYGCAANAPVRSGPVEQETLFIFPDGTMKLMGRSIPKDDVVIYPDGYGGERAAVKVRIEPLHPNFYRDTIVVKRVSESEIEAERQTE